MFCVILSKIFDYVASGVYAMGKIYNCIPGILIHDSSIMNRILTLLDSVQFNKWIEVNEKSLFIPIFSRK